MKLTGTMIKRLMRRHHTTIRAIKNKHQITLKRIRDVRKTGVDGFLAAEWIYFITGDWPVTTTLPRIKDLD